MEEGVERLQEPEDQDICIFYISQESTHEIEALWSPKQDIRDNISRYAITDGKNLIESHL